MNEQQQIGGTIAWNVITVLIRLIVGYLLVWLLWQVSTMQRTLRDLDGKLEVVGLTLENQRERLDDLAVEVRDQRISTRTAIKNLTTEIERQNEPSQLIFSWTPARPRQNACGRTAYPTVWPRQWDHWERC